LPGFQPLQAWEPGEHCNGQRVQPTGEQYMKIKKGEGKSKSRMRTVGSRTRAKAASTNTQTRRVKVAGKGGAPSVERTQKTRATRRAAPSVSRSAGMKERILTGSDLAQPLDAAAGGAYQVQPPTKLNDTAEQLVKTGAYAPAADGTKCIIFLQDFAHACFSYTGFDGKVANQIVVFLRTGADDWERLYDVKQNDMLADALSTAQDHANQGRFVVIGLKNSDDEPGHVAVVITGQLQASGKWKKAGLPEMVPMIAQAGTSVFPPPSQHLGFGISPDSVAAGELVVYVRQA
jgi:hypothetical protein